MNLDATLEAVRLAERRRIVFELRGFADDLYEAGAESIAVALTNKLDLICEDGNP